MRYLLIALACAALGAVSGYWGGEQAARAARAANTYNRALAIVFLSGYMAVAGLVIGLGTAFWTRNYNMSTLLTTAIAAVITLAVVAVCALLTFSPR